MGGEGEEIACLIGERIRELRKERGLNQEEMSYRSGLHRTEMSQLERGLRLPRVDTLIKVAASLEVNLEELVGQLAWSPGEYREGGFTVRPPAKREEPSGGEGR
jgi:transcriptional regulator with XRE-family HTH domain